MSGGPLLDKVLTHKTIAKRMRDQGNDPSNCDLGAVLCAARRLVREHLFNGEEKADMSTRKAYCEAAKWCDAKGAEALAEAERESIKPGKKQELNAAVLVGKSEAFDEAADCFEEKAGG
jgi:hypothetical protein